MSHEQQLLRILRDGRWHKLSEILQTAPMMVHSRAAGLRAKGYRIEHRTVGKGSTGSEYRLVGHDRMALTVHTWTVSDYLKGAA